MVAQAFDQGRHSLLQLYQANPLYVLPPSTGIARLFMQAPFIVSFSSYLDESTAMADLITTRSCSARIVGRSSS